MIGVSLDVPFFMTEGSLASGAGRTFLDILGALWLADFEGAFLTGGGSASYFFHYIPETMGRGCDSGGGTFSLIQVDRDHPIRDYLSQYFASQLITREWVEPVDSMHRVFRESSDVHDADGNTLVTAYALLRPDGQWSLLAVNKDHDNPHRVHIAFRDADAKTDRSFSGPVALLTFGSAQYQWHPDSWADPDGPPAKSVINADAGTLFELPKASIMVIRGKMGPQEAALESEPSLTAPSS
jgi:hypothetical protein